MTSHIKGVTAYPCPKTLFLWLTHWGRIKMATFFQTIFSKAFFFNENVRILINISLTFVPKAPNNNIPALVHIMALRRPGDKPLSEPMMVSLLTHICVTRPQWVKEYKACETQDYISMNIIIIFCQNRTRGNSSVHVCQICMQCIVLFHFLCVLILARKSKKGMIISSHPIWLSNLDPCSNKMRAAWNGKDNTVLWHGTWNRK